MARAKPEPDLPRHAVSVLGLTAAQCVVVGDAPVDILAGQAAGPWTVAAAYGYGGRDDLLAADAVLERFADLPGILAALETREPLR